ncbi:MAG: prolyl oligopeptidase family serine peptidase [Egibacteraceae bacterium]
MRYPETPTGDVVDDHHGTKVADPYRWLEDPDAPETRAWVAAQNELTQGWLAGRGERKAIHERLTQLWDHARAGVPWHRGERWFQLRNSGLQDQDVLWVMEAPDAPGRVLLDPNALSTDGTVALTSLGFSQDGERLAYATSEAGSDWLTWRVRDVEDARDHPDVVSWSKFSSAVWAPDASGFFYAAYAAPTRGEEWSQVNTDQQLRFHRLGTTQDDDELIFARPDEPEWGFTPHVTDDGRWLVVEIWQGTDPRNRVWVSALSQEDTIAGIAPRPLLDNFDASYTFVDADGDMLWLHTDAGAPRGRVVAVDARQAPDQALREVIAETDDTLEQVALVGERLVTVHLRHATSRVSRFTLEGRPDGEVELPGLGSVAALAGRREDDALYLSFVSFTAPASVVRHELASGLTEQWWTPDVALDFDALVTEQVFVDSGGVAVPLFCVHRRDVHPGEDGHPTLLYGYGGFNIPLTPRFSVTWAVWLERGGVLAVANLRGGGEYGQAWHDDGRLANKQHVFDDALACAHWLVAHGWTRPERLAISGGSNGGLMAAACLTQRPQAFGAVVIEVGVLDMLRFHIFTIGWAWASDFGTVEDPEQFATLYAYSPLHRVREGTEYPATLIVTGDHDDRVVPAHSLKFGATLQAAQAGSAPVLLRVETRGGHGAGKPTGMLIDERADVLAFLTHTLEGATHD